MSRKAALRGGLFVGKEEGGAEPAEDSLEHRPEAGDSGSIGQGGRLF